MGSIHRGIILQAAMCEKVEMCVSLCVFHAVNDFFISDDACLICWAQKGDSDF